MYTLVTPSKCISFQVHACALLYQQILGGYIVTQFELDV